MDYIHTTDILRFSIHLYNLIGEFTKYNSKIIYLYRFLNCLVFGLNVFTTIASLWQAHGLLYMKSAEGAITAIHTFLKYLCLLYYKRDITNLYKTRLSFWNYDKYNLKLSTRIRYMHHNVMDMQKSVLLVVIFVMLMLYLRPVFNRKEDRFIFYCWIPHSSIIWESLVLFAQYYLITLVIPVVLGCDSVYLAMSLHVLSQLKLLNWELENMKSGDGRTCIEKCIRHHQLMLAIFERMKKIFFWLLLFHYFVTLITGCSQMYMIMLGNTKLVDLVVMALYIGAALTQFAFYAFPVEAIVSELKYISTAVYMSPWFENDAAQRKTILFVMMRAQRQRYLSLGGFMDMNVDAFGSVVRKIFSFCAVLRNVLNN